MTNEKLYEAIGDIKEQHILEAKQPKEKKIFRIMKACALAACLCLVVGIGSIFATIFNSASSGGCGFGEPGSKLLSSHREDFSPAIDSAILAQFENPDDVIKVYRLLSNHWFLSNKLEDFSQVVTTDVCYVYQGDKDGKDNNAAYSVYKIDEQGKIVWNYSCYPSEDTSIPQYFWKLTYEMIDTALADIDYEDYIITKSEQIRTVFVWVRCTTEDLFLTYPSRPDFTGLEIGGIYTLEELQEILTEVDSR